jgi:sugar phosphate isomerase/epimerase
MVLELDRENLMPGAESAPQTGVRIAAFPKCYLDRMLHEKSMTLFDWIEIAARLPISGVETYYPTLENDGAPPSHKYLQSVKSRMDELGLQMPMMCFSPDFTQRDPQARAREIEREKRAIEATQALSGSFCRVLSGQKRPDISREEGISWTVESIQELLPFAQAHGITLTLENHYKDPLWLFPEFAQPADIFLEIVSQIEHPNFGVNYDPSNALIAGDDPQQVLEAVLPRVVTMHASDRALQGGTAEDLRKLDADPIHGYASMVQHGVIGRGLIDYDGIFRMLKSVDFGGWISIEDGPDPDVGEQHLLESAEFLLAKTQEYGLR